jgi:IS6 family transposase
MAPRLLRHSPHSKPAYITADKNAAYPKAAAEMKEDGAPWRWSRLRQVKYLSNIVERDHRNIKRLTSPGLGFGKFLNGSTHAGRL